MKTKINNFLKLLLFVLVFFFTYSSSYAQTTPMRDYNVIAPLPGTSVPCTDSSGRPSECTNLNRYLPTAFNLTVGIAVALAFIMITFGGVTYATSDSLSGTQKGREYITNAIIGLLLVIGSYVILYTINPNILNFSILIPRPRVTSSAPTVTPVTPIGSCAGGGCLPFAGTGLPASGSAVGSGVSAAMMPRLLQLNSLLNANNIPWRITEGGYNPSVTHLSTCHQNGTCVDATPVSKTPAQLNAFFAYAQQNGLRAVFEVRTQDELFNLTSTVNRDGTPRTNPDGTPFVPYRGTITVQNHITGSHFSVYNQ